MHHAKVAKGGKPGRVGGLERQVTLAGPALRAAYLGGRLGWLLGERQGVGPGSASLFWHLNVGWTGHKDA